MQAVCRAEIVDDPAGKLEILRAQLGRLDRGLADPAGHHRRLPGIRGLRLAVQRVDGKFKYGGNVDEAHRRHVADRLAERGAPGDAAARGHLLRRLG
ncbi:hypothetical protein [Microbispora sp. ATCC PTA-5024]|uniref:hypothetical protein n=1 Tax=Microbispora sp. ATCC PTA-5024 TaxID=316330 RepID=UPI0003DCFBD5|nr:hypothetical protein [Microbispora sp. ATCC PTA-5024]ETK33430.1 hypothetical protein MPTA5024_24455 [Microbispora sp. ATCC PTA-5024]